ncbi:MAG: threonine synthase [Pseudomonadales bacterium]|nr:threonine synthase [Pseudomonadales bacterium]
MRFQDAVLVGLAPDGGLLMPENIPSVTSKLDGWRGLSFVELALAVMSEFIDDIPSADLEDLVRRSYAGFDSEDITPLKQVGNIHILELFHGPTLAFKDIALQFLGNLFEYLLKDRDQYMNILGATSGDTGSAAIAGVKGKKNITIFVMYPEGKPSHLQELQMTTTTDKNVHCLAVDGSFDDCQSLMKTVFNDLEFKQQYQLGAVNSVNWARVLAQVVYYAYASLRLSGSGERSVSFSVPTGNFGDILAGYIAKKMGFPIATLMLASNENDILPIFFNTGVYKRSDVHFTLSPSMDIQVASNFERYLFLKLDRDAEAVRRFMQEFEKEGKVVLSHNYPVDEDIQAVSIGTQETLDTIAGVQRIQDYVLDPHTAVGVAAAKLIPGEGPVVCLATAHPAKFPEAIETALAGQEDASVLDALKHPRLSKLEGLKSKSTQISADLDSLKKYITQHALNRTAEESE